jgi:hypothetical protein
MNAPAWERICFHNWRTGLAHTVQDNTEKYKTLFQQKIHFNMAIAEIYSAVWVNKFNLFVPF